MTAKKNAPLAPGSDQDAGAQIPEFCTTLTCTAFLFNGEEEHLQLPEEAVRRYMTGEAFVITLPPKRDIMRGGIEISKYHFLHSSAVYRLYVHEEMREEVEHG